VFGQRGYWGVMTVYLQHTRGFWAQTEPAVSHVRDFRRRISPTLSLLKRVCLFCSRVCLYVGLCMFVCSPITREREGQLSPNFQGAPGMQKFVEGVMCRGQKLAFWFLAGIGRLCATAGRLGTAMGTGQAIGAHTVAGVQCTDAVETGVGADGPARILHTGTGSVGLGRAINETWLPT